MAVGERMRANLHFWHWYPRLLCEGLSEEQLHWQPDNHSNHITFAIWHAYRSEDDLVHGLLAKTPSVFKGGDWQERLNVAETGYSPFGNGLNREQIANVRLPLEDLLDYAEAVGHAVQEYADGLSDEQGTEEIALPFFEATYPMLKTMTREETINFFSIGHTAEHLGEVQYIKGLMGLTGAPL